MEQTIAVVTQVPRLHTVGHQFQTDEQHAEADADVTDGLGVLAFDEHDQDNARDQSDGSQSVRIEQPQKQAAVGLDGAQADDLGRDGGADVRAHDDGYRLTQIQNPRADQSDSQDNRSRGTLNHRGDHGTGENAHDHIAGDLFQYPLQSGAGTVFQTVAHDLNAVEEHGQTAQKLNNGA